MALPKDYAGQGCSLARSLEIVGERWTLLIVRDAFFGVRRFSDFVAHLAIPRAVLSDRLAALVEAKVLTTETGRHGHTEYLLTDKGLSLWPVVHSLLVWGDQHYAPRGPRRLFVHATDDGPIAPSGRCETCQAEVDVADLVITPGPGQQRRPVARDLVSVALTEPHRMLEPIRG